MIKTYPNLMTPVLVWEKLHLAVQQLICVRGDYWLTCGAVEYQVCFLKTVDALNETFLLGPWYLLEHL